METVSMLSPYFTASKAGVEDPITPRITRSRSRGIALNTPTSEPRVDSPHFSASQAEAGPSTPLRKAAKRRRIQGAHDSLLPPTPDSLPRTAKKRSQTKRASAKAKEVIAKDETGELKPIGKIHLVQERLMHDPWKLLVMTTLLNKTAGRAVRPIFQLLLDRYPSAEALSKASVPDLADLLYPLGLFNQRASSLIRFSQQYLAFGWPLSAAAESVPCSNGESPLNLPMPDQFDVKIFYGSGIYASDSFRIYSPLLKGGGAPRTEQKWLDKRSRAIDRMQASGEDDESAEVEDVADWLSDDEDEEGEEEWRKVVPTDKELRRYLIWRWGIEGILYDILKGPKIRKASDRRRLAWLLMDE